MNEERPLRGERGVAADHTDPERLEAVVRVAMDYRGDVTVTLRDGDEVTGYLYDIDARGVHPRLRLLPADGGTRRTVSFEDVVRLELTGRDTAAGKSFETWVRKYVRQKLAGVRADIEAPAPER